MYEVGTVVIYGSEGVCRISEIADVRFTGMEEARPYYILTPISNPTSKVYVPCENEMLVSKMKRVLSYSEIKEMISEDFSLPEWIDDNRLRNKYFKEILLSYDRKKILALAKLLYLAKNGKEQKKRLYTSDEEMLKKIIKILHSEFSSVIKIEPEEVMPFIFGEIECEEK
ncbi:MAG: CarD family transcriptional regulator [Clostridia bacterium]|nr:CarD family transcriptional regulator [Clostridia bacterium]